MTSSLSVTSNNSNPSQASKQPGQECQRNYSPFPLQTQASSSRWEEEEREEALIRPECCNQGWGGGEWGAVRGRRGVIAPGIRTAGASFWAWSPAPGSPWGLEFSYVWGGQPLAGSQK